MVENFLVLALSIIISLIGLELLVRHYIFDPNHSYIRTPGWKMHLRTNNLMPLSGDHTVTINQYGYRGALPNPKSSKTNLSTWNVFRGALMHRR
jgi:hypothetical protein